MSRNRALQVGDGGDVALARNAEGLDERRQVGAWPLDRPFPALLTDADLRLVLGVGWTTFYRLKRLGRFRALVADPVMTPTVRYSGFLVRQWADGGGLSTVRTFGGKRGAQQSVAGVV